jgi:hypothetical protein
MLDDGRESSRGVESIQHLSADHNASGVLASNAGPYFMSSALFRIVSATMMLRKTSVKTVGYFHSVQGENWEERTSGRYHQGLLERFSKERTFGHRPIVLLSSLRRLLDKKRWGAVREVIYSLIPTLEKCRALY